MGYKRWYQGVYGVTFRVKNGNKPVTAGNTSGLNSAHAS